MGGGDCGLKTGREVRTKRVLLLDIRNPVCTERINIKPIILWHILPLSLSSVKGKEQLVRPAGSSNYSYHVISKLLVFWCPHWPLVMSELIIEDAETSMSLVVFMYLSRERKHILRWQQRLGKILQIVLFAHPRCSPRRRCEATGCFPLPLSLCLPSRWIILLFPPFFTALQLVSNSALCLFLRTSLPSVFFFPSPHLRKPLTFCSCRSDTVGNLFTVYAASLCFPLFLPILSDSVNLCFLTLVENPFTRLAGDAHSCVSEKSDVTWWFSSYLKEYTGFNMCWFLWIASNKLGWQEQTQVKKDHKIAQNYTILR